MLTTEQAADIQRRSDAFEAWLGGRTSWRPEEIPTDVPRVTNAERSKLEQYKIARDKPERLFAYIKRARGERFSDVVITTWTGDVLGHGQWGSVFESNMGDKRRAVRCVIAGQTYAGIAYVSAGDYVRLRKLKF